MAVLYKGDYAARADKLIEREQVLDLTLSSPFLKLRILDWHDEQSLSDHKQICFKVNAERTTLVGKRVGRPT
jgi:hypothetical protein